MPKRPAWVTNLRRYTRDSDIPDEKSSEVYSEIHGDSDRAVVIICGSNLEDQVQALLMKNVITMALDDDIYQSLFGINMPISSFSSKTKIARAFKLIDHKIHNELDAVREMRNACAHSQRPISFSTPELKAALRALVKDEQDMFRSANPHPARSHLADRFMFVGKCILIGWSLSGHPRPSTREEFVAFLSAHVALPQK